MPVRASLPPVAGSLLKKRTNVWQIALIIWTSSLPLQPRQEHAWSRELVERSVGALGALCTRRHLLQVLPVDLSHRHALTLVVFHRAVPNLHREPELQIQHARLAHVLGLGAALAKLRLLVPRLWSRLPTVARERFLAYLARLSVRDLLHPHERAFAQTGLA